METGDSEIVLCPKHVQVLTHAAHIRVAEIGLVEPFCEVGEAAICKNEEVDFVEKSARRSSGAVTSVEGTYILLLA